jgi:hypothetical protein
MSNLNSNDTNKRLNNSKVTFSNENIFIADDHDEIEYFNKKNVSTKKIYHSNEGNLNKIPSVNSILKKSKSAASIENLYISVDNNLNDKNINKNKVIKSLPKTKNTNKKSQISLANKTNGSSDIKKSNGSKQSLNKSNENLNQTRKFLSKNNSNNAIKPKQIVPKQIIKSRNAVNNVKSNVKSDSNQSINTRSNESLDSKQFSSVGSKSSLKKIKMETKTKKVIKNQSDLSISTNNMSNSIKSSNFSINTHDSQNERKRLNNNDKSIKLKSVKVFLNEWNLQKILYENIQIGLIVLNILITLVNLGLGTWINIDQRFLFIANISNRLLYSSLNRQIGLFPYLFLAISMITLFVDVCQLFLYIFVRKFLNSHDQTKLKKIIENQQIISSLSKNMKTQKKILQQRVKINHDLKLTKRSIVSVNYMALIVYVVIIASQYFMGIFIHLNLDIILSYEIPQTLLKLIREYEKQVMSVLGMINIMIRIRSVSTNTLEELLIEKMHVQFDCCNYQNPYQFGGN